jgi:site-specific DNA-methyltransferase (adenine-specific)
MIKIYKGDCLEKMAKFPDHFFQQLIGDPPYIATRLPYEERIDWDKFWHHAYRICNPTANIILFSQQPFTTDLINSNRKGFRYEIIWHRDNVTDFLNANKKPLKIHENILVFSQLKSKRTYNPQFSKGKPYKASHFHNSGHWNNVNGGITINTGSRHPVSVVTFEGTRHKKETSHPSEKPLKLLEFLVKTYTNEGDLVLDPFAGSGTTGVACLINNRDAVLIEKDSAFVSECRERIKRYKKLIA